MTINIEKHIRIISRILKKNKKKVVNPPPKKGLGNSVKVNIWWPSLTNNYLKPFPK